jgi:hypothetical protein
MRTVFFGILFPVLSGLTHGLAYPEPAPPEGRPIVRVDANLVLVPVTVTDSRGGVVPNLNRSDFTLTEEKVRQEIIAFSHETVRASVGLVVDLSGSMRYKIKLRPG